MFWKFAPTTSNIDSMLEREDVTLRELLNEDDVLQECKGQNTKLIEFLCKKEVIEDLVEMITVEPGEEEDEAVRYKFPNLACELLTSDVQQINDALGDSEVVTKKLFSFLNKTPPVNPLLASFFSKVVGILLSRKPEPTLDYIKTHEDFLASVLKHLGTSAIMDLLLRMVTCVEAAELRAQVLTWLNENQLIQRLIARIDPSFSEDLHCNSAQSLCDIIRLSREHMYTMQESAQEDPLLNTLEREETVSLLLHHMFDGELSESVIVNGISVLLALLEIRRPAPFGFPDMAPELTQLDVERLARGVSRTLHGVSSRLADFHKLLLNPPQVEVMKCTFGELDPPLGNTRLHVGKLLAAILMTNTHNINSQLADLRMFDALLDLFFKYEYNNFLHTQVAGCVQTVLGNAANISSQPTKSEVVSQNSESGPNSTNEMKNEDEDQDDGENPRMVAPLLAHLFEECRIIQRIMDAWEDNQRQENEEGGHRKGNMGHLTLITNYILDNLEKGVNSDRLKRFLGEMPEEDQGRWQKFLSEVLAEVNERNSRELGGHNPMHFSSDEEGDPDFRDVPFNTDSSLQQAYTDYQLQQMTSNFIDQFGFTDDDFAEPDENMKFDKIENIELDMKCNTNTPSMQLFEAVCKARIPNLNENYEEEDEGTVSAKGDTDRWEEKPITYADDVRTSEEGKVLSTPFTVTVRERTDSSDSAGSDEGAEAIAIKIPGNTEEMDTSQPQEWKASFEESYDSSSSGSSSGSNNSTPTSSPRGYPAGSDVSRTHPMDVVHEQKQNEVEISSSANNDNWANFDELPSSVPESTCSTMTVEIPTSSYKSQPDVPDSTSKEVTKESANAESPMVVMYNQASPSIIEFCSHAVTSSPTSSTMETQNLLEDDGREVSSSHQADEQKTEDMDMDDVSTSPDTAAVTSEAESQPVKGKSDLQEPEKDCSEPSSTSPSPSVAMDTEMNPTSTDESGIKRQRMEVQEQLESEQYQSRVDEDVDIVSMVTISSSSTEARQSSQEDDVITSTGVSQEAVEPSSTSAIQDTTSSEAANGIGNADSVASNDQREQVVTVSVSCTAATDSEPSSSGSADLPGTEVSSSQSQNVSDSVQHNEVSSSSAVKLVNSSATNSPVDSDTSAAESDVKLNGPV